MKLIGSFLIVLGLGIFAYLWYANNRISTVNRTFSPYTLLTSSWEKYKQKFINQDGRVIDFSRNEITTSEGQSYALLRSVWSDDKPTFDLVWKWTSQNLKRPSDHLLSWEWGQREDKSYGIFPNGGDNSASDADTDTALALIFATKRWQDQQYIGPAQNLLNDIWDKETTEINSKRYLTAGSWAQDQNQAIVNPSYFSPAAWRIFAKFDNKHDWNSLISPSYEVLNQSGQLALDKTQAVRLPPDWLALAKPSGEIKVASISGLTTNYSFDAIRTPWRISLDYIWNHNSQARDYLTTSFDYLNQIYQRDQRLVSTYSHDGQPLTNNEDPAMYATLIGELIVANPTLAKRVYEDKVVKLYSNSDNTFLNDLPYYQQNWLWFGAALYNNYLTNYD